MDGSHESQKQFHRPVLCEQVLNYLLTKNSSIVVDGTMGGGGHSEAILKKLNKDARLIGIDQDSEAVSLCRRRFKNDKRVQIIQGNFGEVEQILKKIGIASIDGYLLDLGVSGHQIETAGRGFSYLSDGPLDMRMDANSSLTARDVIADYSEKKLADIFYQYGEERHARQIARHIVRAREKSSIDTTGRLTEIIKGCVPERWQIKTLARIFQSLRIEINQELEKLKKGLMCVYPFLKIGARICVISYHSLEDRIVKRYIRGRSLSFLKYEDDLPHSGFYFRDLTRHVVRPEDDEIRRLSTSRSARLRAAEKVLPEAVQGDF